eukprot:scaffold183735_cov16-Prasinocladus_malaysianus.AAC.1
MAFERHKRGDKTLDSIANVVVLLQYFCRALYAVAMFRETPGASPEKAHIRQLSDNFCHKKKRGVFGSTTPHYVTLLSSCRIRGHSAQRRQSSVAIGVVAHPRASLARYTVTYMLVCVKSLATVLLLLP